MEFMTITRVRVAITKGWCIAKSRHFPADRREPGGFTHG